MRGIIAITGILMMSVGIFLILKELWCLQGAAGAAVIIVGAGLYVDTLIKEEKS